MWINRAGAGRERVDGGRLQVGRHAGGEPAREEPQIVIGPVRSAGQYAGGDGATVTGTGCE